MFTIQDLKVGQRVKVRKGKVAYEGVIVDFSRKRHLFIRPDESPIGLGEYHHRALPHWITEIVEDA